MSVKRNFTYSSILTLSSYIFPLLTFPYVSRVLGVSGIGIANFIDSIIEYAILISMMGISIVGIREVASCKMQKAKLSEVYSNLLILNAISTAIAITIVSVAMFTVPSLQPYKLLLAVGLCKLFMNLFMTEWLFIGLEDFAYITKRALIVKFLYVLSIFAFVRNQSDIIVYYSLSVSSVVINALINLRYARKFVKLSFRKINIRPYMSVFFTNGIYKLVCSLYLSINITWLGFVRDTVQVGYYTTATKLYTIIIALFTAFTNVMLPHLSALLSEGNKEEFWKKIRLSVEALLFFSFPVMTYSIVFGDKMLHILVGDGFENSYLPFRMIMPLVLIIGLSQIFVLQILLPMKKDNKVLRNTVLGALTAIITNLILAKPLGAIGTATTWICSECVVMFASYLTIRNYTSFQIPYKRIGTYMVAYLPLMVVLVVIHYYCVALIEILQLILAAITTILYTLLLQYTVLKSEIYIILLTHPKIKYFMEML